MIAKRSALEIREFTILKSMCTFKPLSEKNVGTCKDVMSKYPVYLNFNIHQKKEDGVYLIFTEVMINEECEEGYSIMALGCGVFDMNPNTKEDEMDALVLNSGVNICITNLRAYIANLTSYYPMGKYNFHLVDMVELYKDKTSENENEAQED